MPDVAGDRLGHREQPLAEIRVADRGTAARGEFPFRLGRQAHEADRIALMRQPVARILRSALPGFPECLISTTAPTSPFLCVAPAV